MSSSSLADYTAGKSSEPTTLAFLYIGSSAFVVGLIGLAVDVGNAIVRFSDVTQLTLRATLVGGIVGLVLGSLLGVVLLKES